MKSEARRTRRGAWLAGASLAVAALGQGLAATARADAAGATQTLALGTLDGSVIYREICAGCHMPDGRGAIGAGRYPALAGDAALRAKEYPARVVLLGQRNMPAFGAGHAVGFFYDPIQLSPAQIAAVVNYVRTHFGNAYKDAVTAADVARLDAK